MVDNQRIISPAQNRDDRLHSKSLATLETFDYKVSSMEYLDVELIIDTTFPFGVLNL